MDASIMLNITYCLLYTHEQLELSQNLLKFGIMDPRKRRPIFSKKSSPQSQSMLRAGNNYIYVEYNPNETAQ
jgi:hypothetical protein